eukprot:s3624_g2.t1
MTNPSAIGNAHSGPRIALAQLAIALAGSCHFDPATGRDRSKPELAGDWVAGMTIVLMLSVCSALAGSFLALRSVWARAGGNLWLHLLLNANLQQTPKL